MKSSLDLGQGLPDPLAGDAGTRGAWRQLWHDRRGATAMIIAVSLPILLAITGLGIDAGWWYAIRRQNQSAADAAALSAAYEVAAGLRSVADNLTPAAATAAAANGWVEDASPPPGLTPIAVTYPCCADTFAAGSVEVLLQQPQAGWFANFASLAGVTIANRAVAMVNKLPPGCVLALNQTAADAINLIDSPTLDAPDCTVVSDSAASSAIHLSSSASIIAATVVTRGQWSLTGTAYTLSLSYPGQTGANLVPDPYAGTLTHVNFLTDGLSTAGKCGSTKANGLTNYANPGGYEPGCIIAGGLDLTGRTIDLAPGTYWLAGNLVVGSSATLECTTCGNGGAGVTIILTAPPAGGTVGTATLGSDANLDLNAPATGPFAGMVVIQDANGLPAGDALPDPDNFNVSASATETLTGLVYFPGAAVTFQGAPAASGPQCLVLVADTIRLRGNPRLATSGCSNLGLSALPVIYTVALVG
jgi:Putative Flp pilus-assembly TadE/G-like